MEVKIYKSNLNVNKSVQCQTIEKNSSKKKKNSIVYNFVINTSNDIQTHKFQFLYKKSCVSEC